MPTRWQVYPRSQRPSDLVRAIAGVFEGQEAVIGTPPNKPQSNTVLAAVRPGLQSLGFQVEESGARISVPLLFGVNGRVEKTFDVDAWHQTERAILEVEAGIAIDARKLYQDLFEAIAMPDINFLCIAVQNAYHPPRRRAAFDDFRRANDIIDSLFSSGRLQLPLSTVMVLGY